MRSMVLAAVLLLTVLGASSASAATPGTCDLAGVKAKSDAFDAATDGYRAAKETLTYVDEQILWARQEIVRLRSNPAGVVNRYALLHAGEYLQSMQAARPEAVRVLSSSEAVLRVAMAEIRKLSAVCKANPPARPRTERELFTVRQ